MKKAALRSSISLLMLFVLILSGCNLPANQADLTATLGVTQAYQTVEARLKQAAGQTPTPNQTPSPTSGVAATATTQATAPVTSPTTPPTTAAPPVASCDIAAPGAPAIDVTIPDNTKMQPGQAFTKVWRLQNVGTCTWSKDYSIAFFSGDEMGASLSVPMPVAVPPGTSVDISVDMVAPQEPGEYQGNWKLKNADNAWFGIGPSGGSPFWVLIEVVEALANTPTATSTSGPGILVSDTKILALNDAIDLDTNLINSGVGEDLLYEFGLGGKPYFTPLNGAAIGIFSDSQPTYADCQATATGGGQLALNGLKGMYLCYVTDQGRRGFVLLKSYDANTSALTIQFLTWVTP